MKVVAALLAALAIAAQAAQMRGGSRVLDLNPAALIGLQPAQLEQTLLAALAAEKVTPGLQVLLDQVKNIALQMENNTNTNYGLTQAEIKKIADQLKACTIAPTVDYGKAVGDLAAVHRQCRTDEAAALGAWKSAGLAKASATSSSGVSCKQLDDMRSLPGQCSSDCLTRANLPVDQYLAAMQKNYGDLLDRYKVLDQDCTKGKEEVTKRSTTHQAAEKDYNAKADECDRRQREMDRKSCELLAAATSSCTQYSKCYTAAKELYDKSMPAWQKAEDGYKTEWVAIQRLECLADSLGDQDDEARKRRIQECSSKDYSPQAQFLSLKYETLQAPMACALPSDVAGTKAYEDKYYAPLLADAPAKACVAECCVAATTATTTTATTTSACRESGNQNPVAQFSVIAGYQWEYTANWDCGGQDLLALPVSKWNGGSASGVASRKECAEKCIADPKCVAFEFPNPGFTDNQNCWVKWGFQQSTRLGKTCGGKHLNGWDYYTLLDRKKCS